MSMTVIGKGKEGLGVKHIKLMTFLNNIKHEMKDNKTAERRRL